jgi:hypothetical protein
MSVLEKLLADSWNAETSKAWNELWEMSATAMMKVPFRHTHQQLESHPS